MRLLLEANPEELSEKSEALIEQLSKAIEGANPELADRLEKAVQLRKEPKLKYPTLQDLQRQTSKAYDKQMELMLKDINKVLDQAATGIRKSETEDNNEVTNQHALNPDIDGSGQHTDSTDDLNKGQSVLHTADSTPQEAAIDNSGQAGDSVTIDEPPRSDSSSLEKGRNATPIGGITPSGKYRRTAKGYEPVKVVSKKPSTQKEESPTTESVEQKLSAKKALAKDIQNTTQKVEAENRHYVHVFGLRIDRKGRYKVGDEAKYSRDLRDDAPPGQFEEGTSTVGIPDIDELDDIMKVLDTLKDYYSPGDDVVLIAGTLNDYGNDPGEFLIGTNEVVGVWGKEAGFFDKSLLAKATPEQVEARKEPAIDPTKDLYDKDDIGHQRVKQVLKRKGYTDYDFDNKQGALFGWSTNELIELVRGKEDGT